VGNTHQTSNDIIRVPRMLKTFYRSIFGFHRVVKTVAIKLPGGVQPSNCKCRRGYVRDGCSSVLG